MKRWSLAVLVLVAGCTQDKKATPPAPTPRAEPKPLEPLERVVPDAGAAVDGGEAPDPIQSVVPLPPVGPKPPEGATAVRLEGDEAKVGGAPLELAKVTGPLLLEVVGDTYMLQVSKTLAALHDAKREVWLKHPDAAIAFKLTLRDEPSYQAWIDDPVPGKLRVIHRADGFELQTNLGKLPGQDRNGPTVPTRGGNMDLTTLQRGFQKVQARFRNAPDVCFVPSHGLELAKVARAMAANWVREDTAFFGEMCLVYARPAR